MSGLRKIGSIVERWQPPNAGHRTDGTVLAGIAWPDVVGQEVAKRTRTGKLRDGVLTVYTAASTWSHQLTFLAPSIIAELRARAPGVVIERLRFVVAGGSGKATFAGPSVTRAGTPRTHPDEPDARSSERKPHGDFTFAGDSAREQ